MRDVHRSIAGLAGLVLSAGAQALAPALDPKPYDVTVPVDQGPTAPPQRVDGVAVSYGGFIKLDALFSVFSDGRVASTDQGRDFFRPASIPVAASNDPRSMFDLHAKDSRFAFKVDASVSGHTLGSLVELDYRSVAGGASEAVTNGFTPRLRRAFASYDGWTLGQDWTTFRNNDAVPEHIDDESGPAEALSTVRQSLLRYSAGPLQVALENSETSLLPAAGTLSGTTPVTATFVTGDSQLPDLVARYDLKTLWGAYAFAAVARELRADNAATGGDAPNQFADGSAFAWGLNASGRLPTFAEGQALFSLTYGNGVGRYVGQAAIADAVVDSGGGLDTIPLAAGYLSYRQPWAPRWRSNLTLATLRASNDAALTGGGATRSVDSGHVNLLYQPLDPLLFGIEYLHAVRTLENGEDGALDRVQFSAKYSF